MLAVGLVAVGVVSGAGVAVGMRLADEPPRAACRTFAALEEESRIGAMLGPVDEPVSYLAHQTEMGALARAFALAAQEGVPAQVEADAEVVAHTLGDRAALVRSAVVRGEGPEVDDEVGDPDGLFPGAWERLEAWSRAHCGDLAIP